MIGSRIIVTCATGEDEQRLLNAGDPGRSALFYLEAFAAEKAGKKICCVRLLT
jgi:hypothetical protein